MLMSHFSTCLCVPQQLCTHSHWQPQGQTQTCWMRSVVELVWLWCSVCGNCWWSQPTIASYSGWVGWGIQQQHSSVEDNSRQMLESLACSLLLAHLHLPSLWRNRAHHLMNIPCEDTTLDRKTKGNKPGAHLQSSQPSVRKEAEK